MRVKTVFEKHNYYNGRMISGSKSGYRHNHPKNDILFNANIFTTSGKKFHGDLDLTKDYIDLQEICNELDEEMIVISEMLGHFDAENRPYEELKADAHAKFIPNKNEYLVRVYDGLKGVTIDNMMVVTGKGVDWKKIKIH